MSAVPETTSPPASLGLAMLCAVLAPTLLAFNLSPSATLLNQLLAVSGWGLVLIGLNPPPLLGAALRRARWPLLALLLLALGVGWSMADALPAALGRSALALLLLAAAVLTAAAGAGDDEAFHNFASALLCAGLASALIALLQVFAPQWADGQWIARSGLPGRAVGNLRQPNHLSSLLVWGLIALLPLARAGRLFAWRLPAALAAGMGVLMVWAVVLTASRTGTLGMLLLALWGLLDRRLARPLRWALLAAPLVYALCWAGTGAWAHQTAHTFGAEQRISEGDISSSRFGIWSNAWALLMAQPWRGVGFGEFNFAWTLGVFPGRPTAFFDHTHNLPLQLAVELGLPMALAVLGLLLAGLVQAGRRAWRVADDLAGHRARAAWMMVLLIAVHSLLEYPLWYAYFLLPAAWAWGHALGAGAAPSPTVAPADLRRSPWLPLGVLVVAGSFYALLDYGKVVAVFSAGDGSSTLEQRIVRGQGSRFFSYHADYAAATTAEHPSEAMAAFDGATHALLDTRLMIAWARALDEAGQRDKARFLAARLREFRNPDARGFFEPCGATPASAPPPFQCESPQRVYTPRDFSR